MDSILWRVSLQAGAQHLLRSAEVKEYHSVSRRILRLRALLADFGYLSRHLYFHPQDSSIEINTGGTALSLTGAHEITSGYVAAAAAGNSRSAIANIIPIVAAQAMPVALDVAGSGNPMTSNTGDNPAYVVISGLGTGATAGARIGWQEVR